MKPYYEGDGVTLYHGDCREVDLPTADAIVADPPYGETCLTWDQWPVGWPARLTTAASSMWCFGSLRMLLEQVSEFVDWRLSHEVVWEKHNGTGLFTDRFRRVHELATHWYRGAWAEIHHEVPTVPEATARTVRKKGRPAQWIGATGDSTYVSQDGGPLLMRSVVFARSMHGRALHPTEKPEGILGPLIEYAVPPGGSVLDPFAGSGSTLLAARLRGRTAVGVEIDERYCEIAARRLDQGVLDFGSAS